MSVLLSNMNFYWMKRSLRRMGPMGGGLGKNMAVGTTNGQPVLIKRHKGPEGEKGADFAYPWLPCLRIMTRRHDSLL
jgi:hypothetical protein